MPDSQFAELCDQVVRQLNADPFIEVWGAFTFVRTISPLQPMGLALPTSYVLSGAP